MTATTAKKLYGTSHNILSITSLFASPQLTFLFHSLFSPTHNQKHNRRGAGRTMASKSDNNNGYNDSVFDWGSRQSFGDFLKSTSIGSGNSEVSGKVFSSMRLSSHGGQGGGEVVVGDDDPTTTPSPRFSRKLRDPRRGVG